MNIQKVNAKKISYGGTRALTTIKYIVIHYTGNNNDSAMGNANYFAKTNTRTAGAHYFIDRKGNVVQSISPKKIAWSVGGFYTKANGAGSLYKKCTNTNSISIELCDVAKKDPSKAQINATKKLINYIQKKCKNAKTIVRHWDVNGKTCPARMAGKNNSRWKAFKKAVTSASSGKKKKPAKAAVILTTKAALNMRKKAGKKYAVITTIPKGRKVTLLHKGTAWDKVRYNGMTGYCSNKYLK